MTFPVGGGDGGAARARWRRVLAALVVAWAVGLVAAAVWSAQSGPVTVREQSPLARGQQTTEDAVATLTAAAGPVADAEVGEPRVTEGCRITLARQGTAVERTVVLTVPSGRAAALLERLAERLPPEWDARYYRGSGRLRADAGDFVSVTAERTEPGRVTARFDTGCRPDDAGP